MPPSVSNEKILLSAIVGALAAGALGLAIAVVYLIAMRVALPARTGMDGLALAASLVVFPVAAVLFTAVIWTPLWLWRRSRKGSTTVGKAAALGALIGLAGGVVFAGPGGFTLSGGAPAFNYALVAVCGGAAFVFELVWRALTGRA